MSLDLPALAAAVAAQGAVVRVLILRAAGSVPRGAGVSMLVWDGGQQGTIGGGALEFAAVTEARAMLAGGTERAVKTLPLGPALGQCCGGSVSLVWERFAVSSLPATLPHARPLGPPAPMPPRVSAHAAGLPPGALPRELDGWLIEAAPLPGRTLWVWGAGHVGRALVAVVAPLPDVALTWIDTGPDRFPAAIPEGVTPVTAADPARLAAHAPQHADHLILTYSHEIDLALCHALLSRGFGSCGLIGSATKWARFRARLMALGHSPAQISRIACPIGDPALGKHPQAIALGVAAGLLRSQARDMVRENRTG